MASVGGPQVAQAGKGEATMKTPPDTWPRWPRSQAHMPTSRRNVKHPGSFLLKEFQQAVWREEPSVLHPFSQCVRDAT